ncbi:MAG: hypothetical protein U0531_18605 [Dehalococcoidia bacterium]
MRGEYAPPGAPRQLDPAAFLKVVDGNPAGACTTSLAPERQRVVRAGYACKITDI